MRVYRKPKADGSKSAVYQYEFRYLGARYRGSTRCTDETAALAFVQKIHEDAQRKHAGLPVTDDTALLADVTREYLVELARRGRTETYQRAIGAALYVVAQEAGVSTVGELDTRALRRALGRLSHLAPATINRHRGAVHGLYRWLYREDRVDSNPAARVAPVELVRTRTNRALTDDELRRLVSAWPPYRREQFATRRVFYLLAASTGLRTGEIVSLRRVDLDLERGLVTLAGKHTKNRRDARLPLTPDVVEELRPLLEGLDPGQRPFTSKINTRTWLNDLERAGIPRDTDEGRVDQHSLRRTFCTRLARAGVPLVHAQRLMRHSDPKLTASVYTRLEIVDDRAAVGRMPSLFAGHAEAANG